MSYLKEIFQDNPHNFTDIVHYFTVIRRFSKLSTSRCLCRILYKKCLYIQN